jgi:hypothetical protein
MNFAYNGVTLSDDSQKVEDCEFRTGPVIHEFFEIFYQSGRGQDGIIHGVHIDDIVERLMEKVSFMSGIPDDNFQRWFQGHQMEPGMRLEHKDSTISQLVRVMG